MRSKCLMFLGFLLLLTAGCNDSAVAPVPLDFGGGDEGKQIAELVDRMNDQSNSVSRLKASFATGTAIGYQATRQYPKYRYELKGTVSVNDNTASATIAIEPHAGGTLVEKPWTFVKEGTAWKIKSAPMP